MKTTTRWWVGLMALPVLGFAVATIRAEGRINTNETAIEKKASAEELRRVRNHQATQNGALNWIGEAIEKIAQEQEVLLPPRKVIPPLPDRVHE